MIYIMQQQNECEVEDVRSVKAHPDYDEDMLGYYGTYMKSSNMCVIQTPLALSADSVWC